MRTWVKNIGFGMVALTVFANVAHGKGYEEFYVKTARTAPVAPAVVDLRKGAFEAARRRDLAALRATFADKVTIYAAKADPSDMEADKFRIVKTVARDKVVMAIAQQGVSGGEVSKAQLARSGLFAIIRLLRDPHIGVNSKMAGAVCNRPVGMPDVAAFRAARAVTKSRIADWLVARQEMGPTDIADAPGQYPSKIFQDQMVLETNETHGNRQWISIAAPDGGKSLFYHAATSYDIAPFFARYVAEHVCFGKVNGSWKITA
ncbi:MAG TPA: hypothetical protein ENJ55_02705, partial [Rhizobiales bacterium]|nr:hypothetical protein [Hyphomicrobiales bacterium]